MFGSGDLGMGVIFTLKDLVTMPARAVRDSLMSVESTATRAAETIEKAGNRIQSGLVAVAATAAMLIGPFAAAVKTSGDFNYAISRAGAISQTSAEGMKALKDIALELGNTTMFTAQQIADSEIVLSQAGFEWQQQIEMLPGLTNLAAAGALSLSEAADHASNSIYQFGMRASDMPRVADVLVNAANKSNQSVQNFGNAMKYLGPTAHSMGIEFEEAAGYIMVMANSGMRGSVGTRAFGTSLVNLAHPTKQAAEMMRMIGFDAFNAEGNFVGLTEMTRRLSRSTEGLTKEQKLMAIDTIFGSEAIQELTQLMDYQLEVMENGTKVVYRGADALEYYTKQNQNAAGVAEKTSKDSLNNFKGDMILMTSAWETMTIQMGDLMEESLRPFVQFLTRAIVAIREFISTPFGAWVVKTAAAIGVIVTALVALNFIFAVLIPAIGSMAVAGASLIITLWPLVAVTSALGYAFFHASEGLAEFAKYKKVLEDGGNGIENIDKDLSAWGAKLDIMSQAMDTWDGKNFKVDNATLEAADKLGVKEAGLSMATWAVRFKEFGKGLDEGFTPLAKTIHQLKEDFKEIMSQLGMGDPGKGPAKASSWKVVGEGIAEAFTAPFKLVLDMVHEIINGILVISKLMTAGTEWVSTFAKVWHATGYTNIGMGLAMSAANEAGNKPFEAAHAKYVHSWWDNPDGTNTLDMGNEVVENMKLKGLIKPANAPMTPPTNGPFGGPRRQDPVIQADIRIEGTIEGTPLFKWIKEKQQLEFKRLDGN